VVRQFFVKNEQILAGIASAATVLGLFFAGWQLKQANSSLEASTVYELQKDGRDLLKALRENKAVYEYILFSGKDSTPDEKIAADVDFGVTQLIQYFSSVINQRRSGAITDTYWPTFNREMCGLLTRPTVRKFWEARVQPGSYSEDFKEWGAKCLSTPKTS
jgi:hypothetical protein